MSAALYRGRPTLPARLADWLASLPAGAEFDSGDALRVASGALGIAASECNQRRAHIHRALLRFEAKRVIERLNRGAGRHGGRARWRLLAEVRA
jgi:hypothetical protein